jgi:anhydro-N-acetylmuramic acid kinase
VKLRPLTVIGLNSGTSMDGVDAAAFLIGPENSSSEARPALKVEMLASVLFEFEPLLQRKMKGIIAAGSVSLDELCRLDASIGEEFARAVSKLLKQHPSLSVDLIGSHGQTVWHSPERKTFAGIECANTMQLGQAAIIAERTRIPVISDFRVQDMAAGGQGAPLVAFADEVLFGKTAGTGILNLGGIANITVLDKTGSAIMAFDTGPANVLIDRCCERLFNRDFDEGGKLAATVEPDEDWLQELLRIPYFHLPAPKTTGRELFGNRFADQLIEKGQNKQLSNEAILATLTALTPASICMQYENLIRGKATIGNIVTGGGGAENETIVKQLTQRWPHELKISRHEDYGVSTKFKEALLFALLAYTSFFRIPNNVPACTGASRKVCLGKLTSP